MAKAEGDTMKKFLVIMLCVAVLAGMCVSFAACGGDGKTLKVGLICLHGDSSTYDKNFIDAMKTACNTKKVKLIIKTDIPEGVECYEAAQDLVDQGCKVIFADSFGHESHMLRAAKEHPEVQFCHATGVMAHTENQANFHNAFANIYEGRYIAGIAGGYNLADKEFKGAGNKLPAKNYDADGNILIGYVGAKPYAEVMSGYTAWFLGVKEGYKAYYAKKSLEAPATIKMQVTYTGEWYDEPAEKTAANTLIANGCALISQHADSMGAPTACENAEVLNVSYNGSTAASCPKTFIVSSRIDWTPYFEYMIDCVLNNTPIVADWTKGLEEKNSPVALTDLGKVAVEGTKEVMDEYKAKIVSGELKVFDLSKFTVEGKTLGLDHKADVVSDPNYEADTVVIKTVGGVSYFAESEFRSAPYFNVIIDGIEILAGAN